MDALIRRFRNRLLPALLLAIGVALLANGLLSYTAPVEAQPVGRAIESYIPLPTLDANTNLPPGQTPGAEASFPADRVATRIVIRRFGIDLPIIQQLPEHGSYPLCDVALFLPSLGQPGSGHATYIYAHAREGMFLPLLISSQSNDGARMIGYVVEVYTSDDYLFIYKITEVRRHTLSLEDAFADTSGRLWMQTSEGPAGTVPKLQVIAEFVSANRTDPSAAHPQAHPRMCR